MRFHLFVLVPILDVMLEHRYRFHGHGSVRRLYQHGRSARSRSMTLRYHPNPTRVHSRVTVVVAKKVYKAATKRNSIRRRIYEIIRKNWDNLQHPYDLAIIVFDPGVLLMPHDELEKQVLQLFSEAQLMGGSRDNLTK